MIGAAPCVYWVGHLDRQTGRFTPDHAEGLLVDYANPFPCFNPSAVDQKGPGGTARRIIMMMDSRASGVYNGIPWDGVHAMPRSLALDGNRLRQDPLPEFEALRGKHTSQKDILVTPDRSGYLQERGDMLEIIAEFEPGDARVFGLKVRLSDDNKTYVRIYYDAVTGEYGVDGNIMEPSHRGYPGLPRSACRQGSVLHPQRATRPDPGVPGQNHGGDLCERADLHHASEGQEPRP